MTTDVEPVPVAMTISRLRPRIVAALMHLATRIRWAEAELRGLGALVRPGDEVFDVGAAHGMYTIPFANLVGPTGRVHSFEPHPRQQRQLRSLRRALGLSEVEIVPSAVGSAAGEHTMRLPYRYGFPIYGHAHVAEGAAALADGIRTRLWSTPLTTIDDRVEQESSTDVSFIKVDVEGFEPSVIAGATRTIDRFSPSLLLEIEDRHLSRYGRDANEFAAELLDRWPQYDMYIYSDESWVPADRIGLHRRNYLFATPEAFTRA